MNQFDPLSYAIVGIEPFLRGIKNVIDQNFSAKRSNVQPRIARRIIKINYAVFFNQSVAEHHIGNIAYTFFALRRKKITGRTGNDFCRLIYRRSKRIKNVP